MVLTVITCANGIERHGERGTAMVREMYFFEPYQRWAVRLSAEPKPCEPGRVGAGRGYPGWTQAGGDDGAEVLGAAVCEAILCYEGVAERWPRSSLRSGVTWVGVNRRQRMWVEGDLHGEGEDVGGPVEDDVDIEHLAGNYDGRLA